MGGHHPLRPLPGGLHALGLDAAAHGAGGGARDGLLLLAVRLHGASTSSPTWTSRRSRSPRSSSWTCRSSGRWPQTGKPMIISTGMADAGEIDEARDRGAPGRGAGDRAAQVHERLPVAARGGEPAHDPARWRSAGTCRSGCPTTPPAIAVPVAAVALGACIVEKHITLSRSDPTADATFSLEPDDVPGDGRRGARRGEGARRGALRADRAEAESRRFRRSLFVVEDMQAGEDAHRSERPLDPARRTGSHPPLRGGPRPPRGARHRARDAAAGT